MVKLKKLEIEDVSLFVQLIKVFELEFETEDLQIPNTDYLRRLLENKNFYVFVAVLNNMVVGGLTAYQLQQYYSTSPIVYIYDVAVQKEFQRQGIGKELMSKFLIYCREIGIEEVFVQADKVDAHALKFYSATGGVPQEVVHFSYPLS
jgi:ribosomal protein S18 acetylase RimI-like enzyme